jgi:exonuclease III
MGNTNSRNTQTSIEQTTPLLTQPLINLTNEESNMEHNLTLQNSTTLPSANNNTLNKTTSQSTNLHDNPPFWNITTFNCRGLNNDTKRECWFEIWKRNNWDIIISTEVNIKPSQEQQWKTSGYCQTWSAGSQTIGTGVGIAYKNHLADRVIKIEKFQGRAIKVDMAFPHKRYVSIIGVYAPATPGIERKELETQILKWIHPKLNDKWHIIVAGDFNEVPNPKRDRESTRKNRKLTNKCSSELLRFLKNHSFTDTYRESNPSKNEFTWCNNSGSRSRIDQIWISSNSTWSCLDAFIINEWKPTITSDHKAVTSIIETWHLEKSHSQNRRKNPNNRFDWQNTNEKQWEKFSEAIEAWASKKNKANEQLDINTTWYQFREQLLCTANKHIKKYQEIKPKTKDIETLIRPILLIQLTELWHLTRKPIDNNYPFTKQRMQIKILSEELKDTISPPQTWDTIDVKKWSDQIGTTLHTFKQTYETETGIRKRQKIKKFTERRYTWLQDNKKSMIRSALDRPKKSIIMSRLIEKDDADNIQIITNPDEIKTKAIQHFQQWTKSDKTLSINTEWEQDYNPIVSINQQWYNPISKPFNTEEIKTVINKMNNNSAPGPSGIPYTAFKKMKNETLTWLTKLFNQILKEEKIPDEWKKGTIYPIPKTNDWENNINITRPITLLETSKKIFTKCITNRLTSIFTTNTILNENNWAALP